MTGHPLATKSLLGGLCLAAAAALPAQTSITTTPANGSHNAHVADHVTAAFSAAAGTPTSGNFIIRGGMSGHRSGAYSGGGTTTLTFDPTENFFPGEEVEATLTDSLPLQGGGTLGAPYSWRFRAAAASASARFDLVSVVYGPSDFFSNAVALGDLDNDGFLDIVVGNEGLFNGGQNRLYLNDGGGGFLPAVNFGGADKTFALILSDLNGDGWLDIIVGNEGQNRLYLNDGSGSFPSGTSFGTDTDKTYALAAGDVDGDGDLDVVVGNNGGQNRVYLNNGAGSLAAGPAFGSGNDATWGVAPGDLDNDGDLDIIVVNDGGYNAPNSIWLNDGNGNFSNSGDFGATSGVTLDVALGDLDGDGNLDIVTADFQGLNGVFLNAGGGNFPLEKLFGSGGKTYSVALGDLDGDGDLDIVLGNDGQRNYACLNDGNGNFPVALPIGPGDDGTKSIALGDLDGDGDLDVVTSNGGENVAYLNGRSTLNILSESLLSSAAEGAAWQYALAAVDGVAASWSLAPGKPAWLDIESATGLLSANPPAGSKGNYSFDVSVAAAGGSPADTRTFELCVDGLWPLPHDSDYEQGISGSFTTGAFAHVQLAPAAAKDGARGLQLDAKPYGLNWPLQEGASPPGQAAADNPARWQVDAPSHVGALEWAVDITGVPGLAVSFDYQIVNSGVQKWYTNFIVEWSDDLGATWNIASGNGAPASGIYRDETVGFAATSFNIFGFNVAQTSLSLRVRWLTKFAREDAVSTWIAIDNFSITAATPPVNPVITTTALPAAVIGAVYDRTLAVVGGMSPYTWSATGLPAWLPLDAATGRLTGTPPAGTMPTTLTLDLTVIDGAANTGTKTLTIAVVDMLAITTTSLPTARVGVNYGPVSLAVTGGSAPYMWTLTAGTLPNGLSFAGNGLTGTPVTGSDGAYTLTFEVWDSGGAMGTSTLLLTVDPPQPLALLTASLPTARVGTPYSTSLSADGGSAPYTWNAASLPPWLTLNTTTGKLSGTPPFGSQGSENILITVADAATPSQDASRTLALTITQTSPSLGGAGGCRVIERPSNGIAVWAALLLGTLFTRRRQT